MAFLLSSLLGSSNEDIQTSSNSISHLHTNNHNFRPLSQDNFKMPLIQNWPREERTWGKFKASYMYNSVYYLRRTKFIVYQLATNNVQIVTGIGVNMLQGSPAIIYPLLFDVKRSLTSNIADYVAVKNTHIPNFPSAHLNTTNLIGSIAFLLFTSFTLSPFFSTALFFDLFWPERIESPAMQRIWKAGSSTICVFQFAASLAITLVIALGEVGSSGVDGEEKDMIREEWQGKQLIYKRYTLGWVLVAFCWVQFGLVVWRYVQSALFANWWIRGGHDVNVDVETNIV